MVGAMSEPLRTLLTGIVLLLSSIVLFILFVEVIYDDDSEKVPLPIGIPLCLIMVLSFLAIVGGAIWWIWS